MKRLLAVCTAALTLMLAGSPAASSIDHAVAAAPLTLMVDGEITATGLYAFSENNLIYVPARVLTEYYSASLSWDNRKKQLTFKTDYSAILLKSGSEFMQYGDGNLEPIAGKIMLRGGHVYFPADELNNLTGADYEYDEAGGEVRIQSGAVSTTVRTPKEPLAAAEGHPAIKLYAELKDGDKYKGYILEAEGRKYRFGWENPRDLSYPPELHAADMDGDGKQEAVIVFTLGHGTGIVEQEVHVIRTQDGTELPVVPAPEAAGKLVSSGVAKDGTDLLMNLKLQKSASPSVSIRIPGRAADGQTVDQAYYGSVVYYSVDGGRLVARINVFIGFGESIGDLKLTYAPSGDGLVPESITFEGYDEYPAAMK